MSETNATAEIVLNAKGVTRSFGFNRVLRGVDLSVPKGCVLGPIGRNRTGKSTLLKCAVGLLRVSSGTCSLLGENSWNLSASAKARLGYVAQVPQLCAWMYVDNLIAYTAAFYPNWNRALEEKMRRRWEIDGGARVGRLSKYDHQRKRAHCTASQ